MSESYIPDNLIAGDFPIVTEGGTLLSGENVVRGTVLGKITSGGKLVKSLSASSDGSETPYGIAVESVDATGGDAVISVYLSGQFDSAQLTLGSSHTVASIKEGLREKGIFLVSTVPAA